MLTTFTCDVPRSLGGVYRRYPFVPKIREYGIFSLCSSELLTVNQDYQKIMYFLIFSSKTARETKHLSIFSFFRAKSSLVRDIRNSVGIYFKLPFGTFKIRWPLAIFDLYQSDFGNMCEN